MTKETKRGRPYGQSEGAAAKKLKGLKELTVQLAREPALNFFDLAKLIAELHTADAGMLRDLPQQTGMSRRRLYYLLAVGQLLGETALSKAEAEEVGWTKLQIIARHLDATGDVSGEHFRTFLKTALATRAHALAGVLLGEDVGSSRAVSFRLDDSARAELNLALVAFGAKKARRGLSGKQGALIKIVRAAMLQLA